MNHTVGEVDTDKYYSIKAYDKDSQFVCELDFISDLTVAQKQIQNDRHFSNATQFVVMEHEAKSTVIAIWNK